MWVKSHNQQCHISEVRWPTTSRANPINLSLLKGKKKDVSKKINISQYSTVVLTVVRVMIAKYRKSGISGYRSSLTPKPVELK